jgi:hypothetical protein
MTTTGEPSAKDALRRALDLLDAGDWPAAHTIVQQEQSALGAWLHGIVHILEGDLDNARGWYRRASRPFPGPAAARDEIAAARQAIGTAP